MNKTTSCVVSGEYREKLRDCLVSQIRRQRQELLPDETEVSWGRRLTLALRMVTQDFERGGALHLSHRPSTAVRLTSFFDLGPAPYAGEDHVTVHTEVNIGRFPVVDFNKIMFPGATPTSWVIGQDYQRVIMMVTWNESRINHTPHWDKIKRHPFDFIKLAITRHPGLQKPLHQEPVIERAYAEVASWFGDRQAYWDAADAVLDVAREMHDCWKRRMYWWNWEQVAKDLFGLGRGVQIRWQEVDAYFPEMRAVLAMHGYQNLIGHIDHWANRGSVRPLSLLLPDDDPQTEAVWHDGRRKFAGIMAKRLLQR